MIKLKEIFIDLKMPSSQMLQNLVHLDSGFAAKTRYIKTTSEQFSSGHQPIESGTCSYNGIEKNFQEVREACNRLSILLHKRVQCNAYYTPKGAQGLPIHYDLHDVLVLQIEGSKNWSIWPAFRRNITMDTLLLDEKENIKNWTHGHSPQQLTLKTDQSLYLLKGKPHVASTKDEDSLHFSFGIHNE